MTGYIQLQGPQYTGKALPLYPSPANSTSMPVMLGSVPMGQYSGCAMTAVQTMPFEMAMVMPPQERGPSNGTPSSYVVCNSLPRGNNAPAPPAYVAMYPQSQQPAQSAQAPQPSVLYLVPQQPQMWAANGNRPSEVMAYPNPPHRPATVFASNLLTNHDRDAHANGRVGPDDFTASAVCNSDITATRPRQFEFAGKKSTVNVNSVCQHFINGRCNRRKCRFRHTTGPWDFPCAVPSFTAASSNHSAAENSVPPPQKCLAVMYPNGQGEGDQQNTRILNIFDENSGSAKPMMQSTASASETPSHTSATGGNTTSPPSSQTNSSTQWWTGLMQTM